MSKEEYLELLKSPEWQKKRLLIFQRDNFTCVCCHAKDKTLHVHHIRYLAYDVKPWDYPNWMLVTYCETCHETEHLIGDQLRSNFLDLINEHSIYIRPISQLSILIEKYPPFHLRLKSFLDEMLMEYLRQREAESFN